MIKNSKILNKLAIKILSIHKDYIDEIIRNADLVCYDCNEMDLDRLYKLENKTLKLECHIYRLNITNSCSIYYAGKLNNIKNKLKNIYDEIKDKK